VLGYPSAVPDLRPLVSGFSQRGPLFAPRAVCVGFVMYRVALGQIFLQMLPFSFVFIPPPLLHLSSIQSGVLTVSWLAAAV
jgi:hypothetical protein